MQNDQPFVQQNASFVDILLRRWETVMELHILLRHGMQGADEEAMAQTVDSLSIAVQQLDAELDRLRGEARRAGRVFPIDQVIESYDLDIVEAQILHLALMPQLDLSFRHRIARYNNNILYDFVDVDLCLAVLFRTRIERLQARAYFDQSAKLMHHRVLVLRDPKDAKGSGVLGQELRPPERLADFVLCRRTLDAALRPYVELLDPEPELDRVALATSEMDLVRSLVQHFAARTGGGGLVNAFGQAGPFPPQAGLVIAIVGASGTGKTLLAHAIAKALQRPVISVNCHRIAQVNERFGDLAADLFSEATVQGAVLVFERAEGLLNKGNQKLPEMLSRLQSHSGLTILTSSHADDIDSGTERYIGWQFNLTTPEPAERLRIWQLEQPEGVPLDDTVDLQDLGTRFEITGGQIRSAWQVAKKRAQASSNGPHPITQEALKLAAHAQLRANMEEYSVPSKVQLTLEDLILPDDEKEQIREVLSACRNRVFVMSRWGFGRRLVTGKGICVLFKGEPGTGKTLCAEILARELNLKLYQISIPKIVSKYIGETEKNIAKIFSTARANHSMLLFDEADSLFTKRVSVENAIDRFSNMETNLLLQEIERFEGICILTTNLDKNIDDAFARRIQYKVSFPFPDQEHRTLIWQKLFPPECPVDKDVDFEELGFAFELAGGNIKNAVVRAAYRAAERGGRINFDDIEFAAQMECKNAGKLFRATSARAAEW